MSLTNPILTDILTKEVNKLSNNIVSLENRLQNDIEIMNTNIGDFNDKLSKQDNKIDVIHKLFNTYKHNIQNSKSNHESDNVSKNNEVNEILKKKIDIIEENIDKMQSFIINLVNDRFIQYDNKNKLFQESIDKVCLSTPSSQTEILNKLSLIEETNRSINLQMTNIRNQYNMISKTISDNNYRLNGLESKYRGLDRKMHNLYENNYNNNYNNDYEYNSYQDNQHIENINNTENEGENWIKVTKKNRNRRPNSGTRYRY